VVAPIELSLRVKGEKELKRTKQLIDQVEKTVGKLNKVKITFNTSEAERSLDKLNTQLEVAASVTKRFFGSNALRSGIGAFSAATGEAKKQVQALRIALQEAKTDTDRTAFALQALSGQFKVSRLEGQAFARASKDFFKSEGAGSLDKRLQEISAFPKTLAASSEALRELTFMQSMAVAGTDEFVRVNAALGRQLELNAGLLERAARAQKPFSAGMSMVPPGLQRPALPAAGQTSGTRQLTTDSQKTAVAFVQAATASQDFAENLGKAAADAATLPPIFNIVSKSLRGVSRSTQVSTVKAKKQRRQSIISSALIGGGFPLLFGQGPGAAIGGGIGGGIGGAIGGAFGFAGGIVGTAIGQAIDQFVAGIAEVGTALLKPIDNIDLLVQKIGAVNSELEANITVLQGLGLEGVAAQAAFEELETAVGKGGVKALEDFGKSWQKMTNAFNRLFTLIGSMVAGPLGLFVDLIAELVRLIPGVKPGDGKPKANKMSLLGPLPTVSTEKPDATGNAEQAIADAMGRQVKLAESKTRVEAISLKTRRDTLAIEQGSIKIQELDGKIATVTANIDSGRLDDARLQNAEHERTLLTNERNLAVEKQRNALTKAQRAILRERIGVQNRLLGLIGQLNGVELNRLKATNGQFATRQEEFNKIDQTLSLEKARLANQLETNLLGKQEGEITVRLRAENEFLVKLAEDRARLEKTLLAQRHAEYDLGRLQVRQALDLEKVRARMDAQRKIRETSPFERQQFLLDPFFGSSRELAAGQGANFREQVSMMNFQLAQNQAGLDVAGISPERRQALEDQRAQLELNLALFKEYQPAVDEAALAQARFSDALAITKPVTDDLFDSLLSVVEGTKSAEEAFADFLRNIASMLFEAAKSIIAQYLAIGYARLFAFPGSSAGPVAPDVQSGAGFGLGNKILVGGMRTAASGKGALMNQPYLVGERGPELFVPKGNGTIVPNHQMGGGASVTVNVDASGSSVEGNANQASQLGKAIGVAVQQELLKQKRPGGLLAN